MSAVTTTRAFQVYWNYQVWTLAEGERVDGGLADYLLSTGSPVEEIETGPAVDVDGDGVPEGSAKDVLAWVGADPARAALALDAEARRDPSRITLVKALQPIAATAPPPGPVVTEPAATGPVEPATQS